MQRGRVPSDAPEHMGMAATLSSSDWPDLEGTGQGEDRLAEHLCSLKPGRWALWREVGLRAPGFPVSGLDAFGSPDETTRLQEVAADPRFLEAVTWQNRAARRNAVARVQHSNGRDDSDSRRRLDVVASYWQRYCAKNETIGFFGPMGWATVDDGPHAIVQHPGRDLLAARNVRFEVWAIQALADSLCRDPAVRRWLCPRRRPDRRPPELAGHLAQVYAACDGRTPAWQLGDLDALASLVERGLVQWGIPVPLGPDPEHHLRSELERIEGPGVRDRALASLDALEEARSAVACSAGDAGALDRALEELDVRFVRSTGLAPGRSAGATYGGRTLCYEDCRRDLEVRIGQPLKDALANALLPLLPGARWYCGQVAEVARGLLSDAVASIRKQVGRGPVPALDVWNRVVPQLVARPTEVLELQRELQRRFSSLLEAGSDSLDERAELAFADAPPAWRNALYMSPDVQIGASSADAIDAGDFFVVVGDFHPGTASVEQCFALEQHPDPDRVRQLMATDVHPPRLFPVPRPDLPRMPSTAGDHLNGNGASARRVAGSTWSGRSVPGFVLREDLCVLTAAETAMPQGYRTVNLAELTVTERAGEAVLTIPDEGVEVPLEEAFWLDTFLLAFWTYEPFPAVGHAERLTVGRAVLRRETWNPAAGSLDWALARRGSGASEARSWAQGLGMPRRVFVLSPTEAKPFYVDFDSPSLTRVLGRMVRRSVETYGPEVTLRFTEMLPTPDQCWLTDAAGNRYTSELRLVVADLTRWPSPSTVRLADFAVS